MKNYNQGPLISVIISTYNRAWCIDRAINSVRKQTYTNWELIIVDDGSTDNTKEKIGSYLKSNNIKYIYQENKGVCAARNLGIEIAKGEYISLLDSDDEYLSGRLKLQIECMDKTGAKFCLSNRKIFIDGKEHKRNHAININDCFIIKNYNEYKKQKLPLSASFMMFKKEIYSNIMFDINLPAANDLDFFLRILGKYRVCFVNTILNINHKTLNYPRISTDFQKKVQGYKIILKKITTGVYTLSVSERQKLEEYLFKLLAISSFLGGKPFNSRKYFKKYFQLSNCFKLGFIKFKLIYFLSFLPFLSKFFNFVIKFLWKKRFIKF
jgi:glycosyltransferase involved in cell wall biosynthesis